MIFYFISDIWDYIFGLDGNGKDWNKDRGVKGGIKINYGCCGEGGLIGFCELGGFEMLWFW
jgi:hypothetical protein